MPFVVRWANLQKNLNKLNIHWKLKYKSLYTLANISYFPPDPGGGDLARSYWQLQQPIRTSKSYQDAGMRRFSRVTIMYANRCLEPPRFTRFFTYSSGIHKWSEVLGKYYEREMIFGKCCIKNVSSVITILNLRFLAHFII